MASYNPASINAIQPTNYGAKADNGATTITSADISGNPHGWIGTYTSGTTWDTVGWQEAIYAAYAVTSTPGNVIWNNHAGLSAANRRIFTTHGTYGLNSPLLIVATGLDVDCETKLNTVLNWQGPVATPMLTCDGLSYGRFGGLTLQSTQFADWNPAAIPVLMSLTYTGTYPAVDTQNISFYDLVVACSTNGGGIVVAPGGGSQQGSTITFSTCQFTGNGLAYYAVADFGQNAININFFNCDVQGFTTYAVLNVGGSVNIYGSSFENQARNDYAPMQSQICKGGADVATLFGAGNAQHSVVRDCRSEGEILAIGSGGPMAVSNCSSIAAGVIQWGATTAYQEGQTVSGGTKGKTFILVDDGGPLNWGVPTAGTTASAVFDSTQSWSTNQYAGYELIFRNYSGGIRQTTIVSNTATELVLSPPLSYIDAIPTQCQYKIASSTGASPPNWDICPQGFSLINPGSSQGFNTTAGSNLVTVGGVILQNLAVDDYVVIPGAFGLGIGVGVDPTYPITGGALIAQVTNISGSTVTLSKNATFSLSNAAGYFGAGLADGNLTWMACEFPAMSLLLSHQDCYNAAGLVYGSGPGINYYPSRPDWNANPYIFNMITSVSQIQQDAIYNIVSGTTITLTQGSTLRSKYALLIPGSNATINFPAIPSNTNILGTTKPGGSSIPGVSSYAQEFIILIQTSGSSSYTLTFGTNSSPTGTYATGTSTAKNGYIRFVWNGTTWLEVGRQLPI